MNRVLLSKSYRSLVVTIVEFWSCEFCFWTESSIFFFFFFHLFYFQRVSATYTPILLLKPFITYNKTNEYVNTPSLPLLVYNFYSLWGFFFCFLFFSLQNGPLTKGIKVLLLHERPTYNFSYTTRPAYKTEFTSRLVSNLVEAFFIYAFGLGEILGRELLKVIKSIL